MNAFGLGIVNNLKRSANENFLTFSSDNPFSISFANKRWDGVLEYSTDTVSWTEWDASEISSVGNVLYLRGTGNTVITNGSDTAHALIMSSPSNSGINCTGNIMTLLKYTSPKTAVMGASCFAQMFNGCTSLTAAPELPATTLASRCYYGMFYGCTSLVAAPELPATTLAPYCYSYMFYGCINLTTAPELPATTLAVLCYYGMFYGCTSLVAAPELPATTLASYCYDSMFYNCTNIRISSTQTEVYQKEWRIPTIGAISNNPISWSYNMLTGTGGTFKNNPTINTTYYQAG